MPDWTWTSQLTCFLYVVEYRDYHIMLVSGFPGLEKDTVFLDHMMSQRKKEKRKKN